MRLFFGVALSAEAKAAAAAAQARLRDAAGPDARVAWAPVAQLHATLAFLGEQPGAAPALAAGRAAFAGAASFAISLEGVGGFPSPRKPHALYLRIAAGAAELTALAARLSAALVAQGLPVEERPFRPHVTLARVRRGGERDAARALLAAPQGEVARFRCARVALFESTLGSAGATHRALEEFALA